VISQRKMYDILLGRKSVYDDLHKSHSQCLRAIAIQVERLPKTFHSEKSPAAISKMFCHLTGYSSYDDAYKNEKEERERVYAEGCVSAEFNYSNGS
jgi:hypothetical protein